MMLDSILGFTNMHDTLEYVSRPWYVNVMQVKVKVNFDWFQVESHAVRSTYDEHSVKSNYNN